MTDSGEVIGRLLGKSLRYILFFCLLFGGLAHAEEKAEQEQRCPRGYKGAFLEKGKKPKWGRAVKLCTDRYRERAHELDLRFIRMYDYEVTGPNTEVVLELISRQAEVVHILRDGYYYGEFIDDKRTNLGTRTRRVSLLLKSVPTPSKRKSVDVETLEYFYTIGEYEWSKTHVTKVKNVTRLVRIDDKADLAPLGKKQYSVQYRRTVKFHVTKKPVPERAKNRDELIKLYELPIFVEIHFKDPVYERERFFRRFEVKGDTIIESVIPFERKKGTAEPEPAIIYLYRADKLVNKFEMKDTKADDLEINLEVGLNWKPAY
ncbi:MAG: hypothetical protein KDD66_08395 [Bdellovibrionales bacterium]|nr:hypothetical protein [Bdellovibrionales bacterium]